MANATFTEISLSDSKGYRISLDIAPQDGRSAEGLSPQDVVAVLECEGHGLAQGALRDIKLSGTMLSVEVAARDLQDVGTYSIAVDYRLPRADDAHKFESISIKEAVFTATRGEQTEHVPGIFVSRAVVLSPIGSQAPSAGTTATGEDAENKLVALDDLIKEVINRPEYKVMGLKFSDFELYKKEVFEKGNFNFNTSPGVAPSQLSVREASIEAKKRLRGPYRKLDELITKNMGRLYVRFYDLVKIYGYIRRVNNGNIKELEERIAKLEYLHSPEATRV